MTEPQRSSVKPTNRAVLAALAVLLAAAGFLTGLLMRAYSGGPMPVPVTAGFLLIAIAVAVLTTAWPVRRFAAGETVPNFSPLRAARAVVLAKAASTCGAMLFGWFLGHGLAVVTDLDVPALLSNFAWQVGTAVIALIVVVVGLVAESWCRLPEDPDEPDESAAAA